MSATFHIAAMRIALVNVLLLVAACAHSPESTTPSVHVETVPVNPEDVSTIDGVMRAFYEVVNVAPDAPRQWARDRTLYAPWIHFVAIGSKLTVFDHPSFVEQAEPLMREGFREPELRRIVHRYGNIAHVASSYELLRRSDGSRHSRGVNYIQLYFDGQRWWIASVVWQDEDAAHPLPPELSPPSP